MADAPQWPGGGGSALSIPLAQKDVASGVAGLDAGTKLKVAELPASVANGVFLPINVKAAAYGAVGDGVTDDRAAIQAAITAANGGVVYFPGPATTYFVNVGATPLTIVDGTTLLFESQATKLLAGPTNSTTTDMVLIKLTGTQSVTILNGTLQGPAAYGAGGTMHGIRHVGTAGTITVRDSTIAGFVWGVRKDMPSGQLDTVSIELYDSKLIGAGAAHASTPIVTNTSALGYGAKSVIAHGCQFSAFGDPAGGGLYHALYIATDHDVDISGCRFFGAFGSGNFAIQIYDSSVPLANAAKNVKIENNQFEATLGNTYGVVTSYNVLTKVLGNTFANGKRAMQIPGQAEVVGNTVYGGGGDWQIRTAAGGQSTGLPIGGLISDNTFSGNTYIGILIDQPNCNFRVLDNRFAGNSTGGSADSYIKIENAGCVVDIEGNDFAGSNNYGDVHISNGSVVNIKRNKFTSSAGAPYICDTGVASGGVAGTLGTLRIIGNDLSNVGGYGPQLSGMTPTLIDSQRNHGSAWAQRNTQGASYSATAWDEIIAYTSTAAAYTVTMPAAASVPAGKPYVIKDESNGAATHNITIARTGTDTFDAAATSLVINTNGGVVRLYARAGGWASA